MHATELPEDLCGATLAGVRELLFDPPDEPGLPMREALALDLPERSLVVEALTETSELRVRIAALKAESPLYRIRDASEDSPFKSFVGKQLRNWWVAHNDGGYTDCFLVAFTPYEGLCFSIPPPHRVALLMPQVQGTAKHWPKRDPRHHFLYLGGPG